MNYTLQEKIAAAKELVKTFHLERLGFFIISIVSVLTLISLTIYSVIVNHIDWSIVFGLFLPAGGISVACGLILKMFSDCLSFLKEELK